MYLPVESGRLIGGRKIEDALYIANIRDTIVIEEIRDDGHRLVQALQ